MFRRLSRLLRRGFGLRRVSALHYELLHRLRVQVLGLRQVVPVLLVVERNHRRGGSPERLGDVLVERLRVSGVFAANHERAQRRRAFDRRDGHDGIPPRDVGPTPRDFARVHRAQRRHLGARARVPPLQVGKARRVAPLGARVGEERSDVDKVQVVLLQALRQSPEKPLRHDVQTRAAHAVLARPPEHVVVADPLLVAHRQRGPLRRRLRHAPRALVAPQHVPRLRPFVQERQEHGIELLGAPDVRVRERAAQRGDGSVAVRHHQRRRVAAFRVQHRHQVLRGERRFLRRRVHVLAVRLSLGQHARTRAVVVQVHDGHLLGARAQLGVDQLAHEQVIPVGPGAHVQRGDDAHRLESARVVRVPVRLHQRPRGGARAANHRDVGEERGVHRAEPPERRARVARHDGQPEGGRRDRRRGGRREREPGGCASAGRRGRRRDAPLTVSP